MRNAWTIAKREFNMYFVSPVAYAVSFVLLVVLGLFFFGSFLGAANFGGPPDPTGPDFAHTLTRAAVDKRSRRNGASGAHLISG